MNLSVITLTLNEEANIGACLDSVKWADELIVVDSGSTDRTLELATSRGARILSIEWKGYGEAKNYALEKAFGNWILWLDADERVPPELAQEIRSLIASRDGEAAGYSVARRAYFLGRWIKHCGWYPSAVIRLFKRGKGRFSGKRVHEEVLVDGSVKRLRNDLIHLTDPNLFHYFQKFNRYTSLAAEEMHSGTRKFLLTDLLIRPFLTFLRMYIFRGGFLDGIEGLILCVVSSAYVFTKYAKLRELERK